MFKPIPKPGFIFLLTAERDGGIYLRETRDLTAQRLKGKKAKTHRAIDLLGSCVVIIPKGQVIYFGKDRDDMIEGRAARCAG